MKRSEVFFGVLRVPLDALAIVAALLLSFLLREQSIDLLPWVQLLEPAVSLPDRIIFFREFVVPSIAIFLSVSALLGLYVLRTTRSTWNEIGRLLLSGVLWLIVVIAWYFLLKKQLFYSRILLLHATFFITLFVMLGRVCVVLLQRILLHNGIGIRLVVSLGEQPIPKNVKKVLVQDYRYKYLGHVKDNKELKSRKDIPSIDLILQTDANPNSKKTIELINLCRSSHIGYAFLPPVFADVPHQLIVERMGLTPLLRFQPTPLDGWGRVWKRAFDIIISSILLILFTPVFILISIAIVIESGFPIFYISRRVGEKGNKNIPMLKFRSMRKNADAQKESLKGKNERIDGPLFKLQNDPRVTRVGRILRRWDLDELPQICNVLIGQMSLVGPRPHLKEEVAKYSEAQRRVFAVKPGVTGLSQVSGRSQLKFAEEVALDLRYIEEWSLLMDLWILWRTIFVVIFRIGAK